VVQDSVPQPRVPNRVFFDLFWLPGLVHCLEESRVVNQSAGQSLYLCPGKSETQSGSQSEKKLRCRFDRPGLIRGADK